jgi:hypothetical protein
MSHPINLLTKDACKSNVGRNVPASCEATPPTGAGMGIPFNPYDYLGTGISAMLNKAQSDAAPFMQQGQKMAQGNLAELQAREAEAQKRLERIEAQLSKPKPGLFTRIRCFFFGGTDC